MNSVTVSRRGNTVFAYKIHRQHRMLRANRKTSEMRIEIINRTVPHAEGFRSGIFKQHAYGIRK